MDKRQHLRIKPSLGDRVTQMICQVLSFFFLLIFVIPIAYVIFSSLYTGSGFSLKGYGLLIGNRMVLTGLKNSVLLTTIGTCYSLLLEIPLAFVLSKQGYGRLTGFFFSLGQVGVALLPLYLLLKKMGLLNTLWGLILPGAVSVYSTMQLRARMLTLSESLEDAAALDGCGTLRYLIQICVPVIAPVIAVSAFRYGCSYWGNTLLANTLLTDESKYPLTMVLNQILIKNQGKSVFGTGITVDMIEASRMAEFGLCLISALPMILLFLLLKRYMKPIDIDSGTVL